MRRQLVLVHGRAQQYKDPDALKAEWLDAFAEGLAKSDLEIPIGHADIRFPYYGQALIEMVKGKSAAEAADVIIRGTQQENDLQAFFNDVFRELMECQGIDEQNLRAIAGDEVVERGPLNWEWLQAVLKAIDMHVPGASSASIALATNDVYRYMNNPAIHKEINTGVADAVSSDPDVETVLVSHSLGTVVAYNLLNKHPKASHWNVPLFVTLGSPLGIKAIRRHVRPISHPSCVTKWFNAFDERDVVALYPLSKKRFGIDPPIENKKDISNETPNRHGISGYIGDKDVAARIHAALIA